MIKFKYVYDSYLLSNYIQVVFKIWSSNSSLNVIDILKK